jgi:exonuclease III
MPPSNSLYNGHQIISNLFYLGCLIENCVFLYPIGDDLTIYSQNCQGLGNTQKRCDIFHYLRKKDNNIICLQNVHIEEKLCSFVKNEWGYDVYFSPYKRNSRGVMVLFRNNFEQKVENIYSYENGNYLILDMLMPNFRLTLVNIYGPNDD